MDRKELARIELEDLSQAIKNLQAFRDKIVSQLAEAEPPKLEHGDYGHYGDGGFWWAWNRNGILELFGIQSGSGEPAQDSHPNLIRDGNAVADLKAMTEPLEEFEFDVMECHINKGEGWAGAVIHIAGTNFTIPEAEEIHLNLGRLLYTRKMKGDK